MPVAPWLHQSNYGNELKGKLVNSFTRELTRKWAEKVADRNKPNSFVCTAVNLSVLPCFNRLMSGTIQDQFWVSPHTHYILVRGNVKHTCLWILSQWNVTVYIYIFIIPEMNETCELLRWVIRKVHLNVFFYWTCLFVVVFSHVCGGWHLWLKSDMVFVKSSVIQNGVCVCESLPPLQRTHFTWSCRICAGRVSIALKSSWRLPHLLAPMTERCSIFLSLFLIISSSTPSTMF